MGFVISIFSFWDASVFFLSDSMRQVPSVKDGFSSCSCENSIDPCSFLKLMPMAVLGRRWGGRGWLLILANALALCMGQHWAPCAAQTVTCHAGVPPGRSSAHVLPRPHFSLLPAFLPTLPEVHDSAKQKRLRSSATYTKHLKHKLNYMATVWEGSQPSSSRSG